MANKKPAKTAQQPAGEAIADDTPETTRPVHGPRATPVRLHGEAHLRKVLKQSNDVPIAQVCEEAALRLTEFFSQAPSVPRVSDDEV